MLLGCSVFSSLLLTSLHVYLSLSSVLMATYLRWKNTACKQHVWGAGWLKNPALNRGLGSYDEIEIFLHGFALYIHPTALPPKSRPRRRHLRTSAGLSLPARRGAGQPGSGQRWAAPVWDSSYTHKSNAFYEWECHQRDQLQEHMHK